MREVRPSSRKETRTIGGCRLLRELSADGGKCVYLAEQVRLGCRRVAVKMVSLGSDVTEDSGQTIEAERHCLNEAEMLGRFSHPHILPIHDSGYDRGRFYLVTQYTAAGSLADALDDTGRRLWETPITAELVVGLVSQAASALQYVHGCGFVHNDVQPRNILIDTQPCGTWRLLLSGFGYATRLDATPETPHSSSDAAYIAPERFAGQATPASDQYALAALASLLLTGYPSFEDSAATTNVAQSAPELPCARGLNPSAPAQVKAVIAQALAKEPDARYPSVTAFAQALRRAVWETDETRIIRPAPHEPVPVTLDAEPATYILGVASPVATIASYPMTEVGRTRPATPTPAQPPMRWKTRAPHAAHEARVLAVGLAGLFLLLLIAATSPGVLPFAPSQGVGLAQPLPSWGARAHAQTISYGRVNAPPPTVPSDGDGDAQRRPGAVSSDRASPLPRTLAIATAPGEQIAARFSFANNGDTSWSYAKGYALACASRRHTHATCLGFTPISFGGYAVPPGGHFTFTVRLTAPPQSGSYAIWLNVGRNGQLFGTHDLLLQVTT